MAQEAVWLVAAVLLVAPAAAQTPAAVATREAELRAKLAAARTSGDGRALAEAAGALGEWLVDAGRAADAAPLLGEAIAQDGAEPRSDQRRLALAQALAMQGKWVEAEALYGPALAKLDDGSLQRAFALRVPLYYRAKTLAALDEIDRGEALMRRIVAAEETQLGRDHPDVAATLDGLARLLAGVERYKAADAAARRAVAILERRPDQTVALATPLQTLASIFYDQARYEESEPLERRALDLLRAALGERAVPVLKAKQGLTNTLDMLGRYDEEEALLREIMSACLDAGWDDQAVHFANVLAHLLAQIGRAEDAIAFGRFALDVAGRGKVSDARRVDILMGLGRSHHAARKFFEAEPHLRNALALAEKTYPAGNRNIGAALHHLGINQLRQARAAEAEIFLRRARDLFIVRWEGDEYAADVAWVTLDLADAAAKQRRTGDARRLYELAIEGYRRSFPAAARRQAEAVIPFARFAVRDLGDAALARRQARAVGAIVLAQSARVSLDKDARAAFERNRMIFRTSVEAAWRLARRTS